MNCDLSPKCWDNLVSLLLCHPPSDKFNPSESEPKQAVFSLSRLCWSVYRNNRR
ncbi:hypothetical protein LEMLEM_LOCUS3790 [Lemmus lemmus]